MSSLFVPNEGKKNFKDLLDLECHKFSDDVLIFGAGNLIFALQDFSSLPLVLKKRPKDVHSFCLHDGELYDTSLDMKIRHTLTDKVVAERGTIIQDIISYGGCLLDAGGDGKIYATKSSNVAYDLAGDSWDGVFCMGVVDDEELYCGFGGIMKGSQYIMKLDGNSQRQIGSRQDIPRVMCTHNGVLYDAGDYKLVYETLTSKEIIKRDSWISGLCVHKGRLLDTDGSGKIFDTFLDKELYDVGFKIRYMLSVPKESLEVAL